MIKFLPNTLFLIKGLQLRQPLLGLPSVRRWSKQQPVGANLSQRTTKDDVEKPNRFIFFLYPN